ncbi:MAG: TonB-dependent receptor [Flavobacterium sp.]|nr:TonB-dependent receptor [Candidatus Neoflavobacterium equi]
MRYLLYLPLLLLCTLGVQAQSKFNISGTITDQSNNETLSGVTLYLQELQDGTMTNEYGYYTLSVPAGKYTLLVQYPGYATFSETITVNGNIKKNISISDSNTSLSEVIIEANSKRIAIDRPEMSVNKLTAEEIKKMPVVLGEPDLLKSILQLPGVVNSGEGSSGFNVRGGASDQNLILLDEATIYNSSHLYGFFSVFNSDAIKDMKLYKGGIPARFGGRGSSILEIQQKNGNSKDFAFSGGIGLLSSRLLAEGPIVKDKSSFIIAGRSSYAHLFLKLADNDNTAYFYDLNAKFNYNINDNNKVYLSGYFGRDVFKFNSIFKNNYGNTLVNFRWNHLFNDQLFSNATLIYSDYYYGLNLSFVGFNWDSGIVNYNFKYDFQHYINSGLSLKYGFNGIYYDFNPGVITPDSENSGINYYKIAHKYAVEPAVYVEAEQRLSKKINVNYGFRYSTFFRLGSETINTYDNNQAVAYDPLTETYTKGTPTGSQTFGKGDKISDFGYIEPRLAVTYVLDEDQSFKGSYNRMAQYIHLISNTTSATPLDVWTPSGPFIKPQIVDQVALGYFRNFNNDNYSLEAETYYKKGKNRLDYIDGADLIGNSAIEQVLLNGITRSYGLELLFRKNKGRWNGWVAYTLSKAEQKTAGRTPLEKGINYGAWYNTAQDRTHDISVVANYELNAKWQLNGNFIVQSGRPATFPDGQYQYYDQTIPSYDLRNQDRLPTYHHLDVSATYTPQKTNKRWQAEWVFGIYNIYNRKNAASINFRENEDVKGQNEAARLSIFGIIPSVSYNFKF